MVGCNHTKILTWNMQQATYRSAGDIAMTGLLDANVSQPEATRYVRALVAFLERGEVTKAALRDAVYAAIPDGQQAAFRPYVDSLLLVIPSQIQANQQIPLDVRIALISFLRDGALRASELYQEGR